MESKYITDFAQRSDLAQIVAIEEEFFSGYSRLFDEPFLIKWYEHNPAMFSVIKDHDDTVLGFFIVCPMTKNAYDRMVTGEVSDLYDLSNQDILADFNSEYFFIADLCVSKKNKGLSYFRVATALMQTFTILLDSYAKYVVTSPITPEGTRMTQKLGGTEIATQEFDGKTYAIYQLEWTDDIRKKYEKMFHIKLFKDT